MQYVTIETITANLGDNWHVNSNGDSGNVALSVTLANAWLNSKRLPLFKDEQGNTNIPDDVLLAGALIAREVSNGNMYQGKSEGEITAKSVTAGSVSTSKTYANGAEGMTAGEEQALLLIAPYLTKSGLGILSLPIDRA